MTDREGLPPEIDRALRKTLLEITAIPSPYGMEKALCDHLEARLSESLGRTRVSRYQDSLVVQLASSRPTTSKIGLVGHLDTVRTEHDGPARIEGDRLYGAGAADMKAGLAVMIELAERLHREGDLGCELILAFYEREEGPFADNLLGPLLDRFEALRNLDLAICLEPSDNKLQLGCLGAVQAAVRFHGRTAHSARPWEGENAIVLGARVLAEMGEHPPLDVMIDGLLYREVITPTLAHGGRSKNVVPDLFEVNLNYRFAPNRTLEDAVRALRERIGDRGEILVSDRYPPCRPNREHLLVRHLASCGVRAIETKQAWTDSARFDSIGVPAVNFGPGTQAQAHQKNEWTELALLEEAHAVLRRFLTTASLDAGAGRAIGS